MSANSFLGVFAKSPIKPLEQHIDIALKCCEGLRPFFTSVFDKDWDAAAEHRKHISTLEKQADVIKRDIRLSLPSGIFMPIERTDVLELLTHQDKIANRAKDVSGRILGRQLEIPTQIQEDFSKYLDRCIDAAAQARDIINELDDLLETGFKGKEIEVVERMIARLDRIEDDTDSMQINLRSALHSIEKDLYPVDVIFLYQIIEGVGELADIAERVGARLELMLAR